MKYGAYRCYFHIGNLGFKFPRIDLRKNTTNTFCVFLCGIICNILERRRYKYYVLGKPIKYNGRINVYEGPTPILAPTYFSCGILSIVKHIPHEVDEKTFYRHTEDYWHSKTAYLVVNDVKIENFRRDKNNYIYCIDYGDFVLNSFKRISVNSIIYK